MTDRIKDFKLISKEVRNGIEYAVLRNSNGVTVNCVIPIHTAEEEQRIVDNFCRAAVPIVYPDVNVDSVKTIEIRI